MNWLRFHCGNPFCRQTDKAAFALITRPQVMPPLERYAQGHDAHPETAATLILQVGSLEADRGLELHGPGIEDGGARVHLGGLPDGFWQQRRAMENRFPCGVDMVFTCGRRLTVLPRTTRIKV